MGGWMKNNPIPPEFLPGARFTILADRNQSSMRGILEAAMKANPPAVRINKDRRFLRKLHGHRGNRRVRQ